MQTIETLIKEIHSYNLQVHNLFQLPNGTWQANLRDNFNCFEFGYGDTAANALSASLFKFLSTHKAQQTPDLSDLI